MTKMSQFFFTVVCGFVHKCYKVVESKLNQISISINSDFFLRVKTPIKNNLISILSFSLGNSI